MTFFQAERLCIDWLLFCRNWHIQPDHKPPEMAAHRKLDQSRDDHYVGGFHKRVPNVGPRLSWKLIRHTTD